jgi:hypothetical protein
MKAKPRKCVTVGFRQFDSRSESSRFTPYSDKRYSAFDPLLTIAGEKIRFLVDLSIKDEFKQSHFKFLGRWIDVSLQENKIEDRVKEMFQEDMKLVRNSKLNGFMKLWIYQFYILARLAWPFMAHDFSRSFADNLEKSIRVTLKRWAGLFKYADIGSLFRQRDNFGFGLTSVTLHFEKMQVIKCSILKHSTDVDVNRIYGQKEKRESSFKTIWRPSKVISSVEEEVKLKLLFPTQDGRQGLGAGNFNPNPSVQDKRKLVVASVKSMFQQKLDAHSHELALQGVWTGWKDKTVPFDFSWNNLIYGTNPHVLRFVLNATINCNKTPDMLRLWGYTTKAFCPLCGGSQCTLHHILVNCQVSLKNKRYTWRHDSILANLEPVLQKRISEANNIVFKPVVIPPIQRSFVKEGQAANKTTSKLKSSCLLIGAQDWELLVDFDHKKIVFPTIIYSTSKRPDIIIWSLSLRKVILIELTCPAEEGIENARVRKEARYQTMCDNINESGWKCTLMTIEVGARGFIAFSVRKCLKHLGFSKRSSSMICKTLSLVVAKCSCAIYTARDTKFWRQQELLVLNPIA